MHSSHKRLLLDKRIELNNHISSSVGIVTQYLYSKTIISFDMLSEVLCDGTESVKTFRLLDLLPSRGPDAFHTFYEATCYCELWTAADILDPNEAPHYRNAANTRRNHMPLCLPQRSSTPDQIQIPCPQMNLTLNLNHVRLYGQALDQEVRPNYQCNDHSYSPLAIQQCQDSPGSDLTIKECQDRISKFQVPLNINDYVTLAALERKANLGNRKAHEIVTCMAAKAKEYFEAKIRELTADERMTPEKAIRQYISLSKHNSFTDFRFYQVWGLLKPLVGPYILAFNHQDIIFLDFATKLNKDNLQWPISSLERCRKSKDYIYCVILQFQDQTNLTLLSLEFEEICSELEELL